MRPILVALVLGLVGATVALAPSAPDAHADAAPTRTLAVAGAGVGMFPAFDPAVERYAVTSATDEITALTITATTSDPDGTVRINGRPATGARTISGLRPGDEVSVIFSDSGGTAVHALFVTPAGFPTLERVDVGGDGAGMQPGHTLLTLTTFFDGRTYEAAVDANGVPVYARRTPSSTDFKRQPDGRLTVFRATETAGRTGSAMAVLDDRMDEVARYETVGLVNTDPHDSLVLPDGTLYLIAYEPDPATGRTDAVIQHLSASRDVLWEWSSADHVDPDAEAVIDAAGDYAHINSIALMPDGDVLASFRHLSSVFKIARTAHDGYAEGEVVWKLGGRDSTFAFVDELGAPIPGDGGPCAQHTATVVGDDRILLFDNGAWAPGPLCIDPADPTGPVVARTPTRVTEYALDTAAGTATPVWNYEVPDRYAIFAGSAERLDNGNTLVSWASERKALVTEVDAAGDPVWELVDPASPSDLNQRRASYRAFRTPVPDAVAPRVSLTGLPAGSTYTEGARVTPRYACTDRGGSSLRTCRVSGLRNGRLDTSSPGQAQVRVSATDGAGHRTVLTRSYRVAAAAPPPRYRPDASVRRADRRTYRGDGVVGAAGRQTVKAGIERRGRRVFVVRIRNTGNRPERFRLRGKAGNRRFAVTYRVGGRDRTRAVVRGRFRTVRLAPGRSTLVKVAVRRARSAPAGAERRFTLRATSTHGPRRDTVGARVVARRR